MPPRMSGYCPIDWGTTFLWNSRCLWDHKMLSQKMVTLRDTTEENSNLINYVLSCTKKFMLAGNHITFMVEYMPISTAVTFLAVSASCNVFISSPYSLSGLCTHLTTQPSISAIYGTKYGNFQQGSGQFTASEEHYSFWNFHHIPSLSSELYICTSDSKQFRFCGIKCLWQCNISKLVK